MSNFIDSLSTKAGLDPAIAKPAIGHVLLFLRDKAPQGHIAEFIDKTPQASEAVATATASGDGGLTQIIEGLTSFIGHGRADVNILAGKLIKLGLDEKQIAALIEETLSSAGDLIGAEGVREIREIMPALAERSGHEATSVSPAPLRAPIPMPPRPAATKPVQMAQATVNSEDTSSDTGTRKYWVREAVGVFGDADALETAVEELGIAGFTRAEISVLAADHKAKDRLDRLYHNLKEIEESGSAPRTDFVSGSSVAEEEGALLGIPFYIGGAAGIWAVTATGGSLALGSLGASLGAVLAGAIEHARAERIQEQLKLGGLVLWVTTLTPEAEKQALEILNKLGARDVHVHEIQREWSIKTFPIAKVPFDPFVGLLEGSGREKRSA
jgi:hypothetical protein